jgi:hypothetical protein
MTTLTELGTLDVLEAEAVHVIRECAAECERPDHEEYQELVAGAPLDDALDERVLVRRRQR